MMSHAVGGWGGAPLKGPLRRTTERCLGTIAESTENPMRSGYLTLVDYFLRLENPNSAFASSADRMAPSQPEAGKPSRNTVRLN